MPIELIVVLVLAAVAVAGFLVWQSRQRALPSSRAPALPPEEGERGPAVEAEKKEEAPAAPRLPSDEETLPARGEDRPDRAEPLPSEEETQPAPATFRFEPPGQARPSAPAVPLPREKPRPAVVEDVEARRRRDRERYREGLAKTRGGFVARLGRLFRGRPKVDAALRDDVEEVLFTADIGTSTAHKLLDRVTEVLDRSDVADAEAVWSVIRSAALEIVDIPAEPPDFTPEVKPYVLLMIGVNGVGKTTTLGKLAARHVADGRKVLLVAGDTFRAGAVDQLDVWARRVGCDIHRGADKADPSSVIFAGITRGRAEGYDVVLCDTAGRLHTRKELMDELAKVRRAAAKALAAGLPEGTSVPAAGAHDTYLVLDATIGQNAVAQAQMFKETMDFTGLVITKLDGTAKGGVVLGICDELEIPIRFVGIGEGVDDLRPFDAEDFSDALFVERDEATQNREASS